MREIKDKGDFAAANEDVRSCYDESVDALAVRAADDVFDSITCAFAACPETMDVYWNEGSADCVKNPQPPIQMHRYNADTFILRENLCATYEAPFLYLLIGKNKALLIDTGVRPVTAVEFREHVTGYVAL